MVERSSPGVAWPWQQRTLSAGSSWRAYCRWFWSGRAAVSWTRPGVALGTLIFALYALAALLMLGHPFYLAYDSAHSYVHVRLLSDAIWSGHHLPLHARQLENGEAISLPYGVIPWIPAALVYPLLGDWGVTASMVLGMVLLLAAVLVARPAMRSPLLLAVFFANQYLWKGFTQFQIATIWSFAFLLLGVIAFERRRTWPALAGFALCVAVHPLMGTAALALYGLDCLIFRRRWVPFFIILAAGAWALAAPFTWLFLNAPLVEDSSTFTIVRSASDNMQRLAILAIPFFLPSAARFVFRAQTPILAAGLASFAIWFAVLPPLGLWERSEPRFDAYLRQRPIDPATSYRVVTPKIYEDGMAEFVQRGAVLANELYTESVRRQSFPGATAYACFLATKKVGHVVLEGSYVREAGTNEAALLDDLANRGQAGLEYRDDRGTVAYAIRLPVDVARSTVRDCGL